MFHFGQRPNYNTTKAIAITQRGLVVFQRNPKV